MGVHTRESKTYLKVLNSDGTLRMEVPEGTEGCVRREYEDKETKETKVKFEMVYSFVDGMIGDITIQEGKFGDNLLVPITDTVTNETIILSLGLAQNFGEDFLKKLPNIDMSKPVCLTPFSFTGDKGKLLRGIDVKQDFTITDGNLVGGTKVKNHFRDDVAKKNINGIPEPEGDTARFKTDDWKVHFINVRKYLIKYNTDRGLIKDKSQAVATPVADDSAEEEDF